MKHSSTTPADPAPTPPPSPEADACCHGGCNYCVLDLYQEALDEYRRELLAWQQRQAVATP